MRVGRGDQRGKLDCPMIAEHFFESDLKRDVVFIEICEQLFSA